MITVNPTHVVSPATKIRIDEIRIKIDPKTRTHPDHYAEVLLSFFDERGSILASESMYLTEDECSAWASDDEYIINKVLEKRALQRNEG